MLSRVRSSDSTRKGEPPLRLWSQGGTPNNAQCYITFPTISSPSTKFPSFLPTIPLVHRILLSPSPSLHLLQHQQLYTIFPVYQQYYCTLGAWGTYRVKMRTPIDHMSADKVAASPLMSSGAGGVRGEV